MLPFCSEGAEEAEYGVGLNITYFSARHELLFCLLLQAKQRACRQFISILLLINSSITLTRKILDSLFGLNNPAHARTRLAHAEPVHHAGDKLKVISEDERCSFKKVRRKIGCRSAHRLSKATEVQPRLLC